METKEKYARLKSIIGELDHAVIAFSGGVDSTLLLYTAREVLNERIIAVTVDAPIISRREIEDVEFLIKELGVSHRFLTISSLDDPEFTSNTPQRCYLCKKKIFSAIQEIARHEKIPHILDGSNAEDSGDYRPGMRALAEMGIRSPLREAGWTKDEIRSISKDLGLDTWDKPSLACLASRIPYHSPISAENLSQVDEAEGYLISLGFSQVRVRHHGKVARIEVPPAEIPKILDDGLRERIYERLQDIGFEYAALDLRGYRTGSLNEGLDLEK